MVGGAHLRDGGQPDHRPARSTRGTRVPRSRELVTGAVSVRTAWTGAAVSLVVLPRRGRPAQPALPGARAARGDPAGRLPVRQAVHRTSRTRPRPGAGGRRRSAPGSRSPAPSTAPARPGCWARRSGLWIGGFDLIYACQDAEIDRRDRGALRRPPGSAYAPPCTSRRSTHVVTFALFVWFGALVGLGWLWWIGLALTAVAFAYQHVIVTPDRPLQGQPGVLHRQRLRRHRAVPLRAPRPELL